MEDPLLLRYPPPPPISTISLRLTLFLLLLSAALFANHNSSQNIDVTVSSFSVSAESPLVHRRFHLHFVSNGRASAFVLSSSSQIQQILYPSSLYPKKPVRHVTLQLATHDLPEPAAVAPGSEPGSFVISLSPSVVLEKDARGAVESAVRRAVARVWVWDGGDGAGPAVDAVVEGLSGSGEDPIRGNVPGWARLNRWIWEGRRGNASTSAVGPRPFM